jgi:hypothetical protein
LFCCSVKAKSNRAKSIRLHLKKKARISAALHLALRRFDVSNPPVDAPIIAWFDGWEIFDFPFLDSGGRIFTTPSFFFATEPTKAPG